jgi:hypothetical protein
MPLILETPGYRDTFDFLKYRYIAIGDTFFGCIAIDYRDTFRQYIVNNPGYGKKSVDCLS